MVQKRLLRIMRWVLLISVSLLILAALFLNGARLLLFGLSHQRDYVERWASQVIQHPVRIGAVSVRWQGVEPTITFRDVTITQGPNRRALLHIQRLSIGIDVWNSLRQWALLPGRLTLGGTHLDIYQNTQDQWRASESKWSEHSTAFKEMVVWLLTQGHVAIDHVSVNWHDVNGVVHTMRRLRLQVHNSETKHQIQGYVTLDQHKPLQIQLYADLSHVNLSTVIFDAKVFLSAHDIDLNDISQLPWVKPYLHSMRIQHGRANIKAWLTVQHSRLQFIQTLLHLSAVQFSLSARKQPLVIQHLSGNFIWKHFSNGWGIQADQVGIQANQHRWPNNHLAYRFFTCSKEVPSKSQFYVDYLRVQELKNIAIDLGYWPKTLKAFFQKKRVSGAVKHIRYVRIGAQHDISFLAQDVFLHTPALHLNGAFRLSLNGQKSGKGDLYLDNVSLAGKKSSLGLESMSGRLSFSKAHIISGNFKARLWGNDVDIKVLPLSKQPIFRVMLGGNLSIKKIQSIFPRLKQTYLTGQADFRALVKYDPASKRHPFDATLVSDLKGMSIRHLPDLLNKTRSEVTPLRLHFIYQPAAPLQVSLDYHNFLSTALSFDHHFSILSGEVYLGKGHATFQDLPGFVIDGQLPLVEWSKIHAYVQPFIKEKNGAIAIPTVFGLPLRYIEFHFGEVRAYHLKLKHLYFKLIPRQHDWLLNLQNDQIAGLLFLPSRSGGTWAGRFDHLYIPKASSKAQRAKHKPMSRKIMRPLRIPPINVEVQHLYYGKSNFGHVQLITRPLNNGLDIKRFSMQSPHFHVDMKGHWIVAHQKSSTWIKGSFQSNNLGVVLSNWGVSQVLAKGAGTARFALQWPGDPSQFSMKSINGELNFKFSHGRLLKTEGKANSAELSMGRLLNIFSVQSLLRRLTLKFSDITAKGIEFNALKGDFKIKDGIAHIAKASLDGPVAKVKVDGLVNFMKKKYDLHLQVMPYVTSSLPVIVGLVGGPIAGAVTWVVNKAVGPEIGKAMSTKYNVQGTWDQPNVLTLPVPTKTLG